MACGPDAQPGHFGQGLTLSLAHCPQPAGKSRGQLSLVGWRDQGWGPCPPGKARVGVDSGGREDGHVGGSRVPTPHAPFYSHKVKTERVAALPLVLGAQMDLEMED